MDLLEKLKAGTRNKKRVCWPGTDAEVEIRVLSDYDYSEAGLAADNLYKAAGIKIGPENAEAYEFEIHAQLLYRAILNPETGKPVSPSITEFKQLLTRGVREQLIDELTNFQDECSPTPGNMTEAEFDILFERVKKNAETALLSVSSIGVLKRLITTLVSQLQT